MMYDSSGSASDSTRTVSISAERLRYLEYIESNLSSIVDNAVQSYRTTIEKKRDAKKETNLTITVPNRKS